MPSGKKEQGIKWAKETGQTHREMRVLLKIWELKFKEDGAALRARKTARGKAAGLSMCGKGNRKNYNSAGESPGYRGSSQRLRGRHPGARTGVEGNKPK